MNKIKTIIKTVLQLDLAKYKNDFSVIESISNIGLKQTTVL